MKINTSKLESPYFAAIDLGSNSFHMLIARVQDDQVEVVDRVKEMVQLARGISAEGMLDIEAQSRALNCLTRFSERLRDIPRHQIRAVGTKSLRTAREPSFFLKQAELALGVPIQVISGYEEARLVYIGLAHTVANDNNSRLVIDIGGGSTEVIIGLDDEPKLLESLPIGCVTYTENFKSEKERFTRDSFQQAYFTACTELETIRKNYLQAGWNIAYATSGTARVIADLVQHRDGGALINKDSIEWLAEAIFASKSSLKDLPSLRRSVLPAGLAIMKAVFDQLLLETIHVGDAALKEGLLFDNIGRLSDDDSRAKTVVKLQQRYGVDTVQAERVVKTALTLWHQVQGPELPGVSRTKILTWAGALHEIGMSISHSSHHHHGFYILRNSDLGGFGRYEQYILANLIRAQRKGMYAAKFAEIDAQSMEALLPLVICLRLAVLLNRSREDLTMLPQLKVNERHYQLIFQNRWLQDHPLTSDGLQREAEYFTQIGLTLDFE
jgi:exopolyphosphatase/guanosine-5'-triphosphate,3'-diphosphate pyrophosphatase